MAQEKRQVIVEWHDEPNELFQVDVVIDDAWPEYDDDPAIFFYFPSEVEFEEAKTGKGLEFRIVEEVLV